jgi:hypothetical protein
MDLASSAAATRSIQVAAAIICQDGRILLMQRLESACILGI